MSDVRKVPVSFEAFLKRSWPILVAGAVIVLGTCILLIYFALSGKFRGAIVNGAGPDTNTTSTSVANFFARRLDGIPVLPENAALQPYAVMVENSPEARPLLGPARANLVIEAPVEGGITRFMLVMDASTTVAEIGPVRSARPYFVDLAEGLKAVYAPVGGSPDALAQIASTSDFRNLDEIASGKYFWRATTRSAPHNAYTKTELLHDAVVAKGWTPSVFLPWRYLDASSTSAEAPTSTEVSILYGGTFNVRWAFDSQTRTYVRSQAGAVQKDADGTIVTSTNVVVILTDGEVLDDVGRLKLRTTGSGKAWLFRDGKRFEIRWRRSRGAWYSFESIDGGDVLFRPGTTWISLVTSPNMVSESQTK